MLSVSAVVTVAIVTCVFSVIAAFVAGAFTTASYYRVRDKPVNAIETPLASPSTDVIANNAARVEMAAQQIRDLVRNVVSDVNIHGAAMDSAANQLDVIIDSGREHRDVVKEVLATIISANAKLQIQLHEADRRIQSQAAEIVTQQSEARTDALTKLSNRRAFDACLAENIQKLSEGRPFSVVLFDVDHFKKFNDTHGHLAGDQVLRRIGEVLLGTVKRSDLSCRYGGEEFAVIMPNTTARDAQVAAERIRQAIAAATVQFEGQSLSVSASIGVAEGQTGETGTQLVRRADEAVYAAKMAGRNCCHWHDGSDCMAINEPNSQSTASQTHVRPQATLSKSTTLTNRTAFANELSRRIAESRRTGAHLSLLYMRVHQNESARQEGMSDNSALVANSVSNIVRSALRDMDLLVELGSLKFIAMLPGTSAGEAQTVGDRVTMAISNYAVNAQQTPLHVDFWVSGIEPDDTANDIVARAERLTITSRKGEVKAPFSPSQC